MSLGLDQCCAPCPSVQSINIPGQEGPPGADPVDGTNGLNAYTNTTADFVIPAVNSNVTVSVQNASWMVVGQKVFIGDGSVQGTFEVQTVPGSLSVELKFMGYADDSSPGATIATGAGVSPAGTKGSLATTLPTALTDNSTGTASNTIAAGVGVTTLMFHINLVALTAAAADLLTNHVLGYAFKILAVDFVVTTIGAGAGASMTLNMEIGTTNLTGGVVNPTLANTATLGTIVSGTAVTGANVGTVSDSISIEVAAGGTIFTAGQGTLIVKVQNMDSANAIASLSKHINDTLLALA